MFSTDSIIVENVGRNKNKKLVSEILPAAEVTPSKPFSALIGLGLTWIMFSNIRLVSLRYRTMYSRLVFDG